MKVEISISNLYYNPSILGFFFRSQAEKTFYQLLESVDDNETVFSAIENYSDDLDEIEELFYNETVSELCDIFGLTLAEEESDND